MVGLNSFALAVTVSLFIQSHALDLPKNNHLQEREADPWGARLAKAIYTAIVTDIVTDTTTICDETSTTTLAAPTVLSAAYSNVTTTTSAVTTSTSLPSSIASATS